MKKAWIDLKSFITVAMVFILAGIIGASLFGLQLEDNLLLLFTNLATSVFTYYFTKKDNVEESVEEKSTTRETEE